MSNEAAATVQSIKPKLQAGQCLLEGKIDNTEYFQKNNIHYTRLVLPAVDSYSKPDFVIIHSKQALGSQDTIIKGIFQIRGYANYYKAKDDNGNEKQVNTAKMYFEPVD